MGIGFIPDDSDAELDNPIPDSVDVPSSMFGLNPRQMLAMGIAGDDVQRLQQNVTEVRPRPKPHEVHRRHCRLLYVFYVHRRSPSGRLHSMSLRKPRFLFLRSSQLQCAEEVAEVAY